MSSLQITSTSETSSGTCYVGTLRASEREQLPEYSTVEAHFMSKLTPAHRLFYEIDERAKQASSEQEAKDSTVDNGRSVELDDDGNEIENKSTPGPLQCRSKTGSAELPDPNESKKSVENRPVSRLVIYLSGTHDPLKGLRDPADTGSGGSAVTAADDNVSRKVFSNAAQGFTPIETTEKIESGFKAVTAGGSSFVLYPGGREVDASDLPREWRGGAVIRNFDWTEHACSPVHDPNAEKRTNAANRQSKIAFRGSAVGTEPGDPSSGASAFTQDGQDLTRVGKELAPVDQSIEVSDSSDSSNEDLYDVTHPYDQKKKKGPPTQQAVLSEDEEERRKAHIEGMMAGFCSAPTPVGDRTKWRTSDANTRTPDTGLPLMVPSPATDASQAQETSDDSEGSEN